MNKLFLLTLILYLFNSIKISAQFHNYSVKYGIETHLLKASTEFDRDAYFLSLQGRGFLKFELNSYLETEIGFAIGELNGKDFNDKNWSTQLFPADLRLFFSPFKLHSSSPYLYSGLGILRWNISELPTSISDKKSKEAGWVLSIPVGGGIEILVGRNTILDISGGYSFTSTDDLNYFNSPKTKDGYYNLGIGITFIMGSDKNDDDGDELSNKLEYQIGTDPKNKDSDYDGLSDGEEIKYKTNPLVIDTDNDLLSDYDEIKIYKTDPLSKDTDGDNISDYDEVINYHSDPNNKDTDGDGLSDGYEINVYKTNVLLKDSDADGITDREEIFIRKTDPNNYDNEVNSFKTNSLITDSKIKVDKSELLQNTINNKNIITEIKFEPDKFSLNDKSKLILIDIFNKLKTNPNLKIEIRGYTDNTGSAKYNNELSQKRADEVRLWLVKKGIDALRIKAVGLGESNPVADNKTEKGKNQNRRIEIIEIYN